jgi:branched-chain amino acid transport system permease protein
MTEECELMKKSLPWLAAACLVFLFPLVTGEQSDYYVTVLAFVGIYIILAASLDLLVGYLGQISVGHAAFFALGAYSSGILTTKASLGPAPAMIIGLLITGLIAWSLGKAVLALKGYYLAMATFALNVIIYTLIVGLQPLTGGATGLRDIPSFSIPGFTFESAASYFYLIYAVVFLVLIICVAVVKSPLGRTITAIHADEVAAASVGVDCAKHKISIFTVSGMCAALAGSLYAHSMGFISPDDFNVSTSVYILVMVFLGGTGTIFGPAIGAIFLKILPEVTHAFHDYELLINGVILISVLVFMPHGLLGAFSMVRKGVRLARGVR